MATLVGPELVQSVVGAQDFDQRSRSSQEQLPEGFAESEATLDLTDPDRYFRNALNLHVHGVVGNSVDYCAVGEAVPVAHRRIAHDAGVPELIDRTDNWANEGGRDDCEFRVRVGVAESVEDSKPIGVVGVRSQIRWLRLLEDCDRLVGHPVGVGLPSRPILQSLLIVPFGGLFPDTPPQDGEVHAASPAGRHQRLGKMIERRPDVVEEVTSDEGQVGVGLADELKAIDLALVLHPYAHLVWVEARVPSDLKFEIDQVLFGPIDLEDIGWDPNHG